MVTHWRRAAVRTVVVTLLLALAEGARAVAQVPADVPDPRSKPPASAAAPPIDVSLSRIRKQLGETRPPRDPSLSSLLKLEYYVQVVGTPPPIDFFKEFNIGRASSVQYGGMTHAEFIRMTQPFWRKW